MSHKEEGLGRLFILDCVAIVIAVFGMLALSGVKRGAEIRGDLVIILLFMTGIRLIIMALGDFTGAAKRFWAAGLFILLAELVVIAVEYLMAFGISIRLLLMTAAADFALVVAVHIFWGKRQKKQLAAEDETAKKPSWLLRGSVLEDDVPAAQAADPDETAEAMTSDAAFQFDGGPEDEAADFFEEDSLFKPETVAEAQSAPEDEGDAFDGIGGFFAGQEDEAAVPAAADASETEAPGEAVRFDGGPEDEAVDLFEEEDSLFEPETVAEAQSIPEEEGDAFDGIGGFFAGQEDEAGVPAAADASEMKAPGEAVRFDGGPEDEAVDLFEEEDSLFEPETVAEAQSIPEEEGDAFDGIKASSSFEAPEPTAPEEALETADAFRNEADFEKTESAEAAEASAGLEKSVAASGPIATEAPEKAAAVSGDISEAEAELDRFIDMVSDPATDRETFAAVTRSFCDSLYRLPQKTADPAILEAGANLAGQLSFVTKRDHLNDAIVDGLIRIAQLFNCPPTEPAAKRPASVDISADRRTVSASRVPESRHAVDVSEGEVILDSGDSEIIIREEDLEAIRRYMAAHNDSN
ncbi:hypothetical protein HMP0721_1224 [Pseudoramibacter alactolyticus ATCC 23263]|uniref:Uncharacterized protein n=1 Tax=Pseudoramibacter alactolyticus ATCC 23263 TaxID=887929 RepID=E6MGU1_9FIRM|nr:hypothetical protein [Pseudoramibacter alactolyticus]EFV01831.1 hypothetical protein HMP0721_1224 [Pseudoramibacter alactolyticus ATCC 23263]